MKELDVLLTRYLQTRWPGASAAERSEFEALLELPDPQIAAYLMGRENAPEGGLSALIQVLRSALE